MCRSTAQCSTVHYEAIKYSRVQRTQYGAVEISTLYRSAGENDEMHFRIVNKPKHLVFK